MNSIQAKQLVHSSLLRPRLGFTAAAVFKPIVRYCGSKRLTLVKTCAAVLLLGMMNLAAALDINTANAEQIAAGLKGVGLKKAQAIVDYRSSQGRFKNLDDLLKVKGIGKKLLDLNAANISFSPNKSGASQ